MLVICQSRDAEIDAGVYLSGQARRREVFEKVIVTVFNSHFFLFHVDPVKYF